MTSNLDVLRSRSGGSFKGKLRASRSPEENRLYPWLHAHACNLESGAAGVHAPAPAALDAEAPVEEENVRARKRQVLDAGAGAHAQVIKKKNKKQKTNRIGSSSEAENLKEKFKEHAQWALSNLDLLRSRKASCFKE